MTISEIWNDQYRSTAAVFSILAIWIGITVLIGWVSDIHLLQAFQPGGVTMKVNTALCIVLTGLSIPLLMRGYRVFGLALASIVFLLAGLSTFEYWFGLDFGIDQLFIVDAGDSYTSHAGRMARTTGVAFLTLSSALFATAIPRQWWAVVLALPSFFLAYVSFIGYLYGTNTLFFITGYTTMAFHTAAAIMMLSAAVMCANPAGAFMSVITSNRIGGITLRRMLPIVLLVLTLLGFLALQGYLLGWYGHEMRLAIHVTSSAFSLIVILIVMGRQMNLQEEDRYRLTQEVAVKGQKLTELHETMQKKQTVRAAKEWKQEAERLQELVVLLESQLGEKYTEKK